VLDCAQHINGSKNDEDSGKCKGKGHDLGDSQLNIVIDIMEIK
jgi:hypothetical protein